MTTHLTKIDYRDIQLKIEGTGEDTFECRCLGGPFSCRHENGQTHRNLLFLKEKNNAA
jgi:hypothetical protein